MDFSLKRIARFYLAVLLFAFIAYQVIPIQPIPEGVNFHNPSIFDVINSFIGVGRAESGSIILDNSPVIPTYTISGGVACYTHTCSITWNIIGINVANYNYLSSMKFALTGSDTYANSYESTTFTFVSGSSGSGGYAWYDRNTSAVYYAPNADTIITSSPIVLSFAKNIFANITVDLTSATAIGMTTTSLDATHPVALTGLYDGGSKSLQGVYFPVIVSTRGTDTYNVSYLPNNLFSVDVVKNPYLDTKYFINSYAGTAGYYSQETTYNKVNIVGAIFQYGAGIQLNATLASGVYSAVGINSTLANPITTIGNITFNKSTYEFGQLANISFNISNTDYSTYTYGIQLLDPDNNIVETGMLPYNYSAFPFLTTTSTAFDQGGVWEIQLFQCGYGLCNTNKYVFATDTAIVFGGAFNSVLSYQNLTLQSRYNTYYNNSKFIIDFGIVYTAMWNQTTQYSHRIDLIDPNAVSVSSYAPIKICDEASAIELLFPSTLFNCVAVDTNFDANDFIEDPVVDLTPDEISSSVSFSSSTAWINGTYQVKLYEINSLSGTPSLLATDSFDVLNQSGVVAPGGEGANPPGQNPNEPVDSSGILVLLQNNTFWALLLTVGIMLGVGALAGKNNRDNSAPVVPMVMAGFLGLAVTSMIGWMPLWITFGTLLIVIVGFAWQQATKTNTGSQ